MPRLSQGGVAPHLVAIGILATGAGWLATSSLQQDFAAYYTAGAAVRHGLDPYVNQLPTPGGPWDGISVYGHSRFLYPPLIAEGFRPLSALPFLWAKAIFTALSVAAVLVSLGLVTRDVSLGGAGDQGGARAVFPLLWAIWLPVYVTIERGQIDLLLLSALAAAWHWRDRPFVAGPLLALGAMGKPMVCGVLPLLIFARRYRWFAATLGAIGLLGAANIAICGRALSVEYLREVLPRAAMYGEGGPQELMLTDAQLARVSDDLTAGLARIDGGGRAYPQEIGTFRRNASLPRLLAGWDAPSTSSSIVLYLILATALAIGAWRSADNAAWYWGGLLAAVIAAPVSWAMSLVWALPLFSLWPRDRARERYRTFGVLLALTFAAGMLGPVLAPAWVVTALAAVAAAVVATIGRKAVA